MAVRKTRYNRWRVSVKVPGYGLVPFSEYPREADARRADADLRELLRLVRLATEEEPLLTWQGKRDTIAGWCQKLGLPNTLPIFREARKQRKDPRDLLLSLLRDTFPEPK